MRIRFFWLPKEVIFYVLIPMVCILLIYFIFYLIYRKKKGTYYYNYVVDYVYSTLGIVFCGLLFCLLLGYSIATFQILVMNKLLENYIILAIILVILPIIPAFFLIYVIRIYLKNLKRKVRLDEDLEKKEEEKLEYNKEVVNDYKPIYEDIELVKKNS